MWREQTLDVDLDDVTCRLERPRSPEPMFPGAATTLASAPAATAGVDRHVDVEVTAPPSESCMRTAWRAVSRRVC